MNPELLMFPSSLVGGRPRPRRPFTDSFSSYVPSWGDVPEADGEAVPMAPLRRRHSCFFDEVGMRSPTEFERSPDGGAGEVAVNEAYLEQASGATLIAILVLGEFHGFSLAVHEILYSYYFAPLVNKAGFYHLRSRDGTLLVEEPSRGIRGNYPFGDGWDSRYMFVKIHEPVGYPASWRNVDVSRPVSYAGEAVAKLIMGIFLGNVVRLPLSVVYEEYQKAKARKRRPSYTPLPRLARAALSAKGLSSTSSTSVGVGPNRDPLVDAHGRLIGEVFLLRGQMQDMVARRDLLVKQVKASARWELMKEWLEKHVEHWNPEEEYRRHLFLSGGISHQSGSLS
ncbi:hypothetical protein DY000_02030941 [Brassica cretica]|uniref:Uncharacterized protein n=1 Tax=Brassica cretica TaxID=69181 RepID=A0ABQ7DEV8_BRACR|nr:hypothetical protein DY000_02030941 [Brassica cretica]